MDQADGAVRAKIDIRFIHNHHIVGIGCEDPFDLRQAQRDARGRVGIGDKDGLVDAAVVVHVDGEILVQRDLGIGHVIERREHRIKAVGDIGKGGGMIVVAERHEREVQRVIRAVGEEHLILLKPVELAEFAREHGTVGVAVEL